MKNITNNKDSNKISNKCTGLFVAMAMATLLLLPQVPRTFAYFTSHIKSDEIKFTYEDIHIRGFVRYDPDSSVAYLSFPEIDVQDMRPTNIELNQVEGMKLSSSEFSHTADTYTVNANAWGIEGDEMVVYLNQEAVKNWLTNLCPDDTTFHLQVSGVGDYKGARIQFSRLDSIFLEYVPEPVVIGIPTGAGDPEPDTLPVAEELLPGEEDLTIPEPGDDSLTEMPPEELTDEPVEVPADEPDVTDETEEKALEDSTGDPTNEKSDEAVEQSAEETSKDPSGGDPTHQGGETQHD